MTILIFLLMSTYLESHIIIYICFFALKFYWRRINKIWLDLSSIFSHDFCALLRNFLQNSIFFLKNNSELNIITSFFLHFLPSHLPQTLLTTRSQNHRLYSFVSCYCYKLNTHTHIHTYAHTHTGTDTCMHANTHAHTPTHTHAQMPKCINITCSVHLVLLKF